MYGQSMPIMIILCFLNLFIFYICIKSPNHKIDMRS